ncbi:MAG: hypothetical protein RLN75_01870, partial [Longimicrobiales bacterium]
EPGAPPRRPPLDPVATALVVSVGLVFALGLRVPFLVSRGMLVMVPLLLLVLGAGLAEGLRRSRPAGTLALATVAVLGIASIVYFRGIPGPNDHRGLARAMATRLLDDDRIFVPRGDWVTTPVFYHLPDRLDQFVGDDYADVAARPGVDRIWILRYSDIPTPAPMLQALTRYQPVDSVAALRAVAVLYERNDSAGGDR